MPQNENGTVQDLAFYRLALAKEDLAVAIENAAGNHFKAANNRAYYSIYHAITAVLALDNIASKKETLDQIETAKDLIRAVSEYLGADHAQL